MSISHHELPALDDSVPTAIIYTQSDLFSFTIEMRHQGRSHFLAERDNVPRQYASLEQAKRAARSAGAIKAFTACDTVYDEAGLSASQASQMRFDYAPVELDTYY